MSFRKNFFKNILISGGYTYATQVMTFLASTITSRLLAPADFGLIGLITVFSGFISIFSDSGISMAVIRSKYEGTYYRGLHWLSILIGILLCVLTILCIIPIARFYDNKEIIGPGLVISLLFVLRSLSFVPTALLQKQLRFRLLGKMLLISNLLGTVTTIASAYFGSRYWSLVFGQIVTSIITFVMLYKKTGYGITKVRKPVLIKSFYLTRYLIGNLMGFNIVNYWSRNADNLIVGKYYGTSDLGIYSRAYLMLTLPLNLISNLFSSVLYPSLVKFKREGGDVEGEYYFTLKIISLINLPVTIVLILFPHQFVQLLWGSAWIRVADLLPYFGLLVMIQTLLSTQGSVLILENKERALMLSGWVGAVFILTGIIAGAFISLEGIAAFYALSFIILILPFNILYIFGHTLRYVSKLKIFWLPKIVLALALWVALYFSLTKLLLLVLALWIIMVLWDTRIELKKMGQLVLVRYSSNINKNI